MNPVDLKDLEEGMFSDARPADCAICMTGDGLYAIEREVEKAIFF